MARAVRPWIRDLIDQPHPPVPGVRTFTQRQIALWLTGENDPQGDPVERAANFQKRVWRPGRPVLHLAVAQDVVLCTNGAEGNDFGVSLDAVEVFARIVTQAEDVAALIADDLRFATGRADLFRLEWVC